MILLYVLLSACLAEARIVYISPCDYRGEPGKSRWKEKTDATPLPVSSWDIKAVTPNDVVAWSGPGATVVHYKGRVPAERQWYAVTGRVEKVKLEDDGDIHIVLTNSDRKPGKMVVELPAGDAWCDMRRTVFSWTNARFPLKKNDFSLLQHPVVTITGQAFYDIDHSGPDRTQNRRDYDGSIAVWEIHPGMKLALGEARVGTASLPNRPQPMAPPTAPTPTAAPAPPAQEFVTLTKPVPVKIPQYGGEAVLRLGTRLPVVSRDEQRVRVRYMDQVYPIPIDSVDQR